MLIENSRNMLGRCF